MMKNKVFKNQIDKEYENFFSMKKFNEANASSQVYLAKMKKELLEIHSNIKKSILYNNNTK